MNQQEVLEWQAGFTKLTRRGSALELQGGTLDDVQSLIGKWVRYIGPSTDPETGQPGYFGMSMEVIGPAGGIKLPAEWASVEWILKGNETNVYDWYPLLTGMEGAIKIFSHTNYISLRFYPINTNYVDVGINPWITILQVNEFTNEEWGVVPCITIFRPFGKWFEIVE